MIQASILPHVSSSKQKQLLEKKNMAREWLFDGETQGYKYVGFGRYAKSQSVVPKIKQLNN